MPRPSRDLRFPPAAKSPASERGGQDGLQRKDGWHRMKLGLWERIGMLLRANLEELLAQAEDPEGALAKVRTDIQNQLLQVKGQLAIALADHVKLEGMHAEHAQKAAEYMRKA